jgi:hypothetical protein
MRGRVSSIHGLVAALSGVCLFVNPRPARGEYGDLAVGLNVHVPAADLLDLGRAVGVQWVRVDGDWPSLEPSRGRYDWTSLDRVVMQSRGRGLRVFLTLAYTPPWVPRVARARADTAPQNDEPQGSAEWTAFVSAAVARYRPMGVTHFGLWNEPNLDSFWETAAGVDPYIDKILIPGAQAVRRACPDCRVLGPDLAHLGSYDAFLDRVLARARTSFDILAHHIYNGWPETGVGPFDGDNFVQALERRRASFTRISLRELLDARGYTGEVWITETGYRATVGDAAAEGRQATYVRRVLEEQLSRPWWTNTFFYEVTDCGIDQPMCPIDGFGLTRPTRTLMAGARSFPADYRRKPAYDALRAFLTAHPEFGTRRPVLADAGARDAAIDASPSPRDAGSLDAGRTDPVDAAPPGLLDAAPPMDVSLGDVRADAGPSVDVTDEGPITGGSAGCACRASAGPRPTSSAPALALSALALRLGRLGRRTRLAARARNVERP